MCAESSIEAPGTISRWLWAVFSIAIIALAVTTRVGMIAYPFLNDSGLYAAMGKILAHGGVMYQDFYETKLPGAGLIMAAFWLCFGSYWAGYVIGELVLALAAAALLARIARRHIRPSAALPSFLFAVVFLNLGHLVYTGFQLETVQMFFEVVAAFAAMESLANDNLSDAFIVGIAAGIAAMAKPGGIGVAGAFIATLLLITKRRRLANLLAVMLGIAVPIGLTLLYIIRSGARPYLVEVIRDIARYGSGTPMHAEALYKLVIVLTVLAYPMCMRLMRSQKTAAAPPPITWFIIAWFIADFAGVMVQRRLYLYHFLPLCAPAALLYGLVPRVPRLVPVAIGLLPFALLSITWEGSTPSQVAHGFERMPLSDYIIAHTQPSDAVFIDQTGRLLIETNRQPGSRLGTLFYFVNSDDAPQQYCGVLVSDFESRKPKFLIFTKEWDQPVSGLANCDILLHAPHRRDNFIAAWATLREYVHAHYVQAAAIDDKLVYRRK